MSRITRLTLFFCATALLMVGCSGDENGVTQPGHQVMNSTGVVRGEIADNMIAFEFLSDTAGDPADPVPGPFIIRGSNLDYDSEQGVLVVDLTVTNASEQPFSKPVSLTFVQLLPRGVTVENADNDETGAGAAIVFQFENDDAMWSPGEESLPRAVQFGVDQGVSIGFVSRIDVNLNPLGGTIGGVVWEDANEDGIIDSGEPGIPDVGIALYAGPADDIDKDNHMWLTTTAEDGSYRFDGLDAGYYTVVRTERDDLEATTGTQMQVILVEQDGEVSDFLTANFGCVFVDDSVWVPEVGDCIHAKGDYAAEPDRLVARIVCPCDDDDDDWDDGEDGDDGDDDDGDDGDDGEDDKDGQWCKGRLVGPVTDIDLEQRAVAVMGTWVYFDDKDNDFSFMDLQIGERVRVRVQMVRDEESDYLHGCRIKYFNGHFDRVFGPIQEIIYDDGDHIRSIRVLNTLIEVTADFDCDDWD